MYDGACNGACVDCLSVWEGVDWDGGCMEDCLSV